MIDLHYAPTPNGWKITIMLEECGLAYTVDPMQLGRGDQHQPEFLKLNPNGRMPAIVDRAPADGGEPVAMFESGAILIYLAEKAGKFMPREMRARFDVMQWLMWQMGGLGPMLGQNGHFLLYAPEKIPYAIDRYGREARRLYGVLDAHLGEGRDYIAGDYSIADMACFPWIMTHKAQGADAGRFPPCETLVRSAAGTAKAAGRPCCRQSGCCADGRTGAQDHVRRRRTGAFGAAMMAQMHEPRFPHSGFAYSFRCSRPGMTTFFVRPIRNQRKRHDRILL
jgi:GST-like protein